MNTHKVRLNVESDEEVEEEEEEEGEPEEIPGTLVNDFPVLQKLTPERKSSPIHPIVLRSRYKNYETNKIKFRKVKTRKGTNFFCR